MKYNIEIDNRGNKYYYKPNTRILHREDGPAIELNGDKFWYQNGKLHRLDGPASEYNNGSKYWYQNGKLHRENGPAEEYYNGDKSWFQNNRLHRLDGPAIEYGSECKKYYVNGVEYKEKDYWYIVNNNLHVLL